jgi:cytochrome c oxidase subunit 2
VKASVDVQHPRRRRSAQLAVLALVLTVAVSGCSAEASRGFLPGYDDGQVTNMTGRITSLWTGSWIAALAVGVITWGLIIWCVAVYRKRRDDETLPIQLRYHVPLEIMYVILPFLMLGVLYFYTQRDVTAIVDTSEEPDVTVQVWGKRWSWDFNYLDSNVWESGEHVVDVGEPGNPATLPTLYLPVDKRVEIKVDSRDVIHSFWVPAFLFKRDMIPGRESSFQIIPERLGTYAGKCAELCGENHSGMLFNVKVVTQEEYDQHMADLEAAGQVGVLGADLNPTDKPSAATGEN